MKSNNKGNFPDAVNESKVGSYELEVYSGGGYFYDEVLEYRVWFREDGDSYCYAAATYQDAVDFYNEQDDADLPVTLVKQYESIDESGDGGFRHIKEPRVTEWRTEWLEGNQGSREKIPDFLRSHSSKKSKH